MAILDYIYEADDTTEYKIPLDSVWAAVGGFTLATGSEAALPANMEPRHAVLTGLVSREFFQFALPLPTPAALTAFDQNYITVSGLTYRVSSLNGQSLSGSPWFLARGEQGEPGPAGEGDPQEVFCASTLINNAQILTLSGSPIYLTPDAPAGKAIVPIAMSFKYTRVTANLGAGSAIQVKASIATILWTVGASSMTTSNNYSAYASLEASGSTAVQTGDRPHVTVGGANYTNGGGNIRIGLVYALQAV